MIHIRAIAVLVLITLLLANAAAQRTTYPLVRTEVEPTSGTVGDKFQLTLTATVPDIAGLETLPLFDTQTSWTLTASTEGDILPAAGSESKIYHYTIVPFETGRVALPQVAFTYRPRDGSSSTTVLSEPLWVEIDSVLPAGTNATNLRDVKPPEPIPLPKAVVYSGAFLLFIIVGLICWLLWRRYFARLKKMLGGALRPDEKALKELSQLEDEHLIEQKKLKEFYTRLSDSVRVYLAAAYGVDAVDFTSNEMLRALDELAEEQPARNSNDFKLAMARLTELLDEADLVKFARLMPDSSHCRRALQAGRDVVGLTRYRFESDDEEDGKPASGGPPQIQMGPPPPPSMDSRLVSQGERQ